MTEMSTRAFDELAGKQHGLLTSDQAVQALGPNRKNRWVQEGRLMVVQPRVLRAAGAPQTWHQAVMAATLASEGVASHRSAAEMWGLIQPCGYVDVAVAGHRKPRLQPPAVAHQIKDLDPALAPIRNGIPLTDPVRTVIDLGLVVPTWGVRDALSRGLTTKLFTLPQVQQLRHDLGRQGRNGTGIVRQILAERLLSGGQEESVLEARLSTLVQRHELPVPDLQFEVWHAGRFVARVDAAYPAPRVAIEVDGFVAHTTPDARQRDRTRQHRLVALGWTVLRFTWDDIVNRPAAVADEIHQALRRLSAA